MTNCPTNEMALTGLATTQKQPFTVILMMTDDIRSDEDCAADWVRRVWVWGSPDDQGVATMIEHARQNLAEMFDWDVDEPLDAKETRQRMDALEPVAIYAGHIFDIYQP